MKPQFFFAAILLSLSLNAQVKTTMGPAIGNPANKKMKCLVKGDDSTFFACRQGTNGIFIEKYDRTLLLPIYSKEIKELQGINDPQESMLYASGNVYIFKSHYDDLKGITELYYHSIGAQGNVNETRKAIIAIRNVYVQFQVSYNRQFNRILIKASYEPSEANDYVSEMFLFEPKTSLSKTWEKTLKRGRPGKGMQAMSEETLVAMDDGHGNVSNDIGKDHHFYFLFATADKSDGLFYSYQLYVLPAQANTEKVLQMEFEGNYQLNSVKFSRNKNNELVIAGLLKNLEGSRANIGFFCYILNSANTAFIAKTVKFAGDDMLSKIDPNIDNAPKYEYAFDYLIMPGNYIYLVVQQFSKEFSEAPILAGEHAQPAGTPLFSRRHAATPSAATTNTIKYHYRDILILRFDEKGTFEWMNNIPYRHSFTAKIMRHYKQYYATVANDQLFILRNDHINNVNQVNKGDYDPSLIRDAADSASAVMVCTSINNRQCVNQVLFSQGEREKKLLCEGLADHEFFTSIGRNELILYTKINGADQFMKLQLD